MLCGAHDRSACDSSFKPCARSDLGLRLSMVNFCCACAISAFFAFGRIDAFQGHLNPLSSINIFETCVIPVLLYGCDTWLLDSSTILLLEQFQYEIGRRILKLQNNTSGKLVRLCLNLPSLINGLSHSY